MTNTAINPFKKSTEKNSLLTVTLTAEQRGIVEALREHLGLKTNTSVVLEGLAVLYDKHRRQLATATPDPEAEAAE